MSDELIHQAAELMREQTAAYRRLDAVCGQLAASLVREAPEVIEPLVRAGESELLKMRSRLVRIMGALTAFAEARAAGPEATALSAETRTSFAAASQDLLQAAGDFQRTQQRAVALATNGAAFAAVGIEMCGVHPTTYRAPYTRPGEARPWA
jgi:hypothetical protein